MAHTFQVNGSDHEYLTSIEWQDELATGGLDGYSPLGRWRRLTARGVILPMADYVALKALEGQKVSIACPPYTDRNGDYITYYGCDFDGLSGRHEGLNMADVTAQFMVLV